MSSGTARDLQKQLARVVRRVSGVIKIARTSATMVVERVPETIHATRVIGYPDETTA